MATTKQPVVDTETGEVLDIDQPGDPEDGGFEAGMTEISDIEGLTGDEVAEIEESIETDATVSKAADTIGTRLLSAFIDELSAAGVKRNKDTEFVLERLGRRIRSELRRGYLQIMARDVPAVQATMGKVVMGGDKIQAAINIDKHIDARNRHALADFAGSDVLIVMADDVEEHLADMNELAQEAATIQQELDLGEPTTTAEMLDEVQEQIADADKEIDESRIQRKDGEIVGVAPDPECHICNGRGGWDETVTDENDESHQEWVRCECVELPE